MDDTTVQTVIIDTDTRVITRLTTDDNPQVNEGETAIVMETPITYLDGYKKLDVDNRTLLTPTAQEITAAKVDETQVAAQQISNAQVVENAIDAVINDKTAPATVRAYFQALRNL